MRWDLSFTSRITDSVSEVSLEKRLLELFGQHTIQEGVEFEGPFLLKPVGKVANESGLEVDRIDELGKEG